jgi:protein AIR1/2
LERRNSIHCPSDLIGPDRQLQLARGGRRKLSPAGNIFNQLFDLERSDLSTSAPFAIDRTPGVISDIAMRDASGDDGDSRTATIGLPRPRSNGSSAGSRQSSKDGKVGKKQGRRRDGMAGSALQDLVPKGGAFSGVPLDADPTDSHATSSSDPSSANRETESDGKDGKATNGLKRPKSAAPTLNWNKGSRSSIRTTLGAKAMRSGNNDGNTTTKTTFDAVNDKYFRSRSASVSSEEEKDHEADGGDGERSTAFKRLKTDDKPYFVDESEGSGTGEISEGGDSIMLNMQRGLEGGQNDDDYLPFLIDPQPAATVVTPINRPECEPAMDMNGRKRNSETRVQAHVSRQMPKEEAFRVFSQKYPTPPMVLADLNLKDLQSQARHFHYDRIIHDLDLSRPIACTECLQEGHLSIVCPTKEVRKCLVET